MRFPWNPMLWSYFGAHIPSNNLFQNWQFFANFLGKIFFYTYHNNGPWIQSYYHEKIYIIT
jgi:hypothetical protein